MKPFLTALKVLAWTIGGTLTLLVMIVVSIWFFPNLLLNDSALRYFAEKQSMVVFPEGLDSLELRAEKQGWDRRTVILESKSRFCIHIKDPSIEGCFDELRIGAQVRLRFPLSLKVSEIGPIRLHSEKFSLVIPVQSSDASGPSEAPAGEPIWSTVRSWLDPEFRLAELSVRLPSVQAKLPAAWEFSLEIRTDSNSSAGRSYELQARARGPAKETFELKGALEAPGEFRYQAQIQADARISGGIRANAVARGEGHLDRQEGSWKGSASAQGIAPMIARVDLDSFQLDYGQTTRIASELRLKVDFGQPAQQKGSAVRPLRIQPQLKMAASAESTGDQPDLRFKAQLLPYREHGVTLDATIAGTVDPSNAWESLDFSEFGLAIKVPQFKTMVNALKRTQLAVPAPLNALTGSATLEIGRGISKPQLRDGKFPVHLETRLRSSQQALVIDSTGILRRRRKPPGLLLEAQMTLNDIRLQLPDLNPISPLPVFSADPRLKPAELRDSKPSTEPPFFEMALKLKTAQPIRLLYPYFEPAGLLDIDLSIQEASGMTGKVSGVPFKIRYLGRVAELEKLEIRWLEQSQQPLIDGRIRVQRTDYVLFADVSQNGDQNVIRLSSDPPLSEADIISVLLFNQVSSELDPGEAQSSQSTQSAIAGRAFGFFSLWALSSTPVEAVNYNPSTRIFSAKVRLADGFSAEVGSDWDKSQTVGLRKRIGKNWVISTQMRSGDGGKDTQESFLDWYRRF